MFVRRQISPDSALLISFKKHRPPHFVAGLVATQVWIRGARRRISHDSRITAPWLGLLTEPVFDFTVAELT